MKASFHKVYGQRDPAKVTLEPLTVDRPMNFFEVGEALFGKTFYARVMEAVNAHRTKVWEPPQFLYLGVKEKAEFEEYVRTWVAVLPEEFAQSDSLVKQTEFAGMKVAYIDAPEFLRVGL